MIRRPLVLLLAATALLALPAAAPAAVNVAVGVADQSPSMFTNPNYTALHLKRTRYFIHWDAATDPAELSLAKNFVTAAAASHVKVLMHISTNNLTAKAAHLPSVAEYKRAVSKLIAIFKPFGVTDWGVWNEANHVTEPTWNNPTRAAEFYKAMKTICTGCTLVALDVLDQRGVESYISRWMKAAGPSGRTARVIGIHNYSEVNRKIVKGSDTYPGTKRIIARVRKTNKVAKFWYTETGGVVNFGGAFPCDAQRAADRTKYMFTLAKRYAKDVQRLYVYNWNGAGCNGFDAGLVDEHGDPRPAYGVFKSKLAGFKR